MKRGRVDKKRRRDSSNKCIEQRNARTDDRQIDKLNAEGHRAVRERARLQTKFLDKQ